LQENTIGYVILLYNINVNDWRNKVYIYNTHPSQLFGKCS